MLSEINFKLKTCCSKIKESFEILFSNETFFNKIFFLKEVKCSEKIVVKCTNTF